MARVHVRSTMRSTIYQKTPFCSPEITPGQQGQYRARFNTIIRGGAHMNKYWGPHE